MVIFQIQITENQHSMPVDRCWSSTNCKKTSAHLIDFILVWYCNESMNTRMEMFNHRMMNVSKSVECFTDLQQHVPLGEVDANHATIVPLQHSTAQPVLL